MALHKKHRVFALGDDNYNNNNDVYSVFCFLLEEMWSAINRTGHIDSMAEMMNECKP